MTQTTTEMVKTDLDSAYYYLGGDRLHSGQYINLLNLLEQEGLIVNLISGLPISPRRFTVMWTARHSIGPNPVAMVRQQIKGRVYQLPFLTRYPDLSALLLARILGWPGGADRRVVVHAKQVGMGLMAVTAKRWLPNLRVISEMEGDVMAELEYVQDKGRQPLLAWTKAEALIREERRVVRESDALLCVSTKLKEVVTQRNQLTLHGASKIFVFPSVASGQRFCFDSEDRRRTRQALQLDERYVVVYSGNLNAPWQLPGKLVEVFGWIKQQRSSAFFLIMTQDTDHRYIEPYLQGIALSPGDYRLLSCPHSEVVRYLCAADVALLLRERHLMNEVASPGKFAEYVLCGLPIIMTDGIGDYSAQMHGSALACILPDWSELGIAREAVQKFCRNDFSMAQRMAFSQWAAVRFSMEALMPRLVDLYKTV